MALDAKTIDKSAPEWDEQRKRIKLSRTLLGGTRAMQSAGMEYLPKRAKESSDEYAARLKRSVLLNKYALTVNYLVGQVFQKQVKYQEAAAGQSAAAYDKEFFDRFQENVDTQGTNISMFCEKVFRSAMSDGICFILSEYPSIRLARDDEGRTLYQAEDGTWKPRTAQADAENGWRPYWVIIKAGQVLDAWIDSVNGKAVLRAFRYVETLQREKDDGTREIAKRIRAIFPEHWEVWEPVENNEYQLVEKAENQLGLVPVDWFMPGEQSDDTPGLTAIPALDDLAELNRAHWQGYSDHKSLMVMGRAPAWLLKCLGLDQGVDIEFGPGRYCSTDLEAADIRSVGVDAASIDRSFQDLRTMEDYMGLYGLQLIMPQSSGTTATQAQIAAASTDATLKGWVQKLQDCMENALNKIAQWQNQSDGPALFINSEFRMPYDSSFIQQLSNMVGRGQLPLRVLFEALKKMGMIEDMDFDGYVAAISEDQRRNLANTNVEFTPSFGSSLADGVRGTQQ